MFSVYASTASIVLGFLTLIWYAYRDEYKIEFFEQLLLIWASEFVLLAANILLLVIRKQIHIFTPIYWRNSQCNVEDHK